MEWVILGAAGQGGGWGTKSVSPVAGKQVIEENKAGNGNYSKPVWVPGIRTAVALSYPQTWGNSLSL